MAFTLDKRLWLTSDRENVVDEGHPDAAFLLGGEGDEISDDEAARLGLKPSKKAANKADDKSANEPANKAANKAAKVADNK